MLHNPLKSYEIRIVNSYFCDSGKSIDEQCSNIKQTIFSSIFKTPSFSFQKVINPLSASVALI